MGKKDRPTKADKRGARGGGGKQDPATLIKYGLIGLAILAAGPVCMTVYDMLNPPYVRISTADDAALQRTFFSGEPWLIKCDAVEGEYAHTETFHEVARAGRASGEFNAGVLDCREALPSGTSTLGRFKIKARPSDTVILLVANGEKPKRVPNKYLIGDDTDRRAQKLLGWVRNLVIREVFVARNNKLLERCLSKRRALLLLNKGAKVTKAEETLASRLMNENKRLKVCAVDTGKYKIEAKPTLQAEDTTMLLVVPKPDTKTGTMALTYNAKLDAPGAYEALARRLKEKDVENMVAVKRSPTIASLKAKPAKPKRKRVRKERKKAKETPRGLGGEITRKRQRKEERGKQATAQREARKKRAEEHKVKAPQREEAKKKREQKRREQMEAEEADNAFVAQAAEADAADAAAEQAEAEQAKADADAEAADKAAEEADEDEDEDEEAMMSLGGDDDEDGGDEDGGSGGSSSGDDDDSDAGSSGDDGEGESVELEDEESVDLEDEDSVELED